VNPEAYLRNSPFFHVDTINAPLLIIQGDLDGSSTSLAGATRFYQALVKAGKKPAFLRFWGESHIPVLPPRNATMEWVTRWLNHYLSLNNSTDH